MIPLVVLAVTYFSSTRTAGDSASAQTEYQASVAVMPFRDLSAEGDETNLAEGLAVELTSILAQMDGLRVSSSTSTFLLASDGELAVPDIGEALGVSNVVEGSVQREGEAIRITVQLVDAKNDTLLWNETFNRSSDSESLLRLQDEISSAIVAEILGNLDPGSMDSAVKMRSSKVYSSYVEAEALVLKRTPEAYTQAIALLKSAIAQDPDFVQAYGALSLAYHDGISYGGFEQEDAHREMTQYAEKAMELDSKDPNSLLAMGAVKAYQVKAKEAIKLLQQSLARSPQNSRTLAQLARAHALTGRYEEEREFLRKARRLNPLDPAVLSSLTYAEYNLGDMDKAFEVARDNLKWNDDEPDAKFGLANLLVSSANYEEAYDLVTDALKGSPNSIRAVDLLGDIYAYVGMPEEEYAISKRIGSQKVFKDSERGNRRAVEEFIAETPNWDWTGDGKGYLFFQLGDYKRALPYSKNAIKQLEITGPARLGIVEVVWCLHWADLLRKVDDPEGDAVLTKIEEALERFTPANAQAHDVFVAGAGVQMLKGDKDAALDWLEAGVDEGHLFLHLTRANPTFALLADQPRYKALHK